MNLINFSGSIYIFVIVTVEELSDGFKSAAMLPDKPRDRRQIQRVICSLYT